MKKLLITTALIIASSVAQANCVGTEAFKTCNDNSGNSYSVSKFGNTTNVQGYNANTGSSWSQQTYKQGNGYANTYGSDSKGNTWNQQHTPYGSFGTDSDGNSFSSTRR